MPGAASDALQALASAKNTPLLVMLELTSRCDHACGFCYKPVSDRGQELSPREVLQVIDDLADMGALYLQLTGGEATLRPDFRAIAERARSRNFQLSLSTNGERLDDEAARWMAALPMASVQISLHAADPALHDTLVGCPGSHARVMAGTRRLVREGVMVSLVCTVVERNLEQVDELLTLGRELGVGMHFDPRCRQPRRFPEASGWQGPDRGVMEAVLGRPDATPEFLDDPDTVPTQVGRAICAAGRTRLRIDEMGNIYPCNSMPWPVGNVRDGLKQVWRHAPRLQRLRAMTFGKSRCASCELLPHCAPCVGRHLEDTGAMDCPSPTVCWEAALRRRLARKLGQDG